MLLLTQISIKKLAKNKYFLFKKKTKSLKILISQISLIFLFGERKSIIAKGLGLDNLNSMEFFVPCYRYS